MVHIVMIAGTYQPEHCGVGHYTAHLRQGLAERGMQSSVLTTHHAAQVAADPTVRGVVKRWHLTELFSLVQAVRQIHPNCLHIQHAAGTYGFDRAIFLLPLLLRLSGWQRPIVTTVHEYGWWEWQPACVPPGLLEWLKAWGQKQGWWDREDGFLLTQSDAIITTNGNAEQVILHRLPHLKRLLHRIPIAANIETQTIDKLKARQIVQQICGWSDDAAIVAFFSFLHPVKGLETLLAAFQQVVVAQPHTRLLLIGGVESLALPSQQATDYWNQLKTRIAELNLTNDVHMTGYLPTEQVSLYLTAADIGVLPFNPGVTLKSGSLLAMMAHSLPIIATQSDPPDPELANACLKLIPPRNPPELANALVELLTDATQQRQLGQAAFDLSRQFTWSQITEAHLNVYYQLNLA